jgi:hypothetical protein
MHSDSQSRATSRPDWTYSVQAPRTFSPLWLLERLAGLSVPIAGALLLAAANHFGWVNFN